MKKTILTIILLAISARLLTADSEYNPSIGWYRITPSAEWAPRDFHQAIVFEDKMWIIAGSTGTMKTNDVWSSSDGITWNEISKDEEGQWFTPIREGHQSFVFDERIWVLGGYGTKELDDIWTYNKEAEPPKWEKAIGQWPPRVHHQVVLFQNDLWLIGGSTNPPFGINDVWKSTNAINWQQITSQADWDPRFGHQALAFDDKLWLLGGYSGNNYYRDIWSSADGENWNMQTDSPPWESRRDFQALVYKDKIWVMGGLEGASLERINDVWSSSDGITWEEENKSSAWPARSGHQALVFDNKIFILGGKGENDEYYNDIWHSVFPPSYLEAEVISDDTIKWQWPNSPQAEGYRYSINEGEYNYVPPKEEEGMVVLLTEELEPNKKYDLNVYLQLSADEGDYYLKPVTASAMTYADLPKDADYMRDPRFRPETGATKALIKWRASEAASHYRIERNNFILEEEYEYDPSEEVVSYLDEGLIPETGYDYKIFALNKEGEYDPDSYVSLSIKTTAEDESKPERRFITPTRRSVNFGENAREVIISDVRGRTVARLSNGDPFIKWEPDREVRGRLESGIYIYQLKTKDGKTKSGTIVITK